MGRSRMIAAEGIVMRSVWDGGVEVALSNGHRFRAHISGNSGCDFRNLLPGSKVCVSFSPLDLSRGMIFQIEGTPESGVG